MAAPRSCAAFYFLVIAGFASMACAQNSSGFPTAPPMTPTMPRDVEDFLSNFGGQRPAPPVVPRPAQPSATSGALIPPEAYRAPPIHPTPGTTPAPGAAESQQTSPENRTYAVRPSWNAKIPARPVDDTAPCLCEACNHYVSRNDRVCKYCGAALYPTAESRAKQSFGDGGRSSGVRSRGVAKLVWTGAAALLGAVGTVIKLIWASVFGTRSEDA